MLSQKKARVENLIKKIAAAGDSAASGEDQSLIDTFMHQYYARVPFDDLAAIEPLDLYGAALAHMQFGLKREADTSQVRVYNPNFDKDGWQTTHSILEIVTDDMPFLVDSVSAALNRHSITTYLTVHPIIRSQRDKQGRLSKVLTQADTGGGNESFMQFHLDRQTDGAILQNLQQEVAQVLADVRQACRDWHAMREATLKVVTDLQNTAKDAEGVDDAVEFCRWIEDGHFTYLGYCEYSLAGGKNLGLKLTEDAQLGVLREAKCQQQLRAGEFIPMDAQAYLQAPTVMFVTKGNVRSTIHRPSYMDFVGIKRFDSKGNVVGLSCIFGLFTSAAYRRTTRDIPLLRHKAVQVVEASGLIYGSHECKVLENILESYPRDELFQASTEQLVSTAMGILELQERQRIRLFMRADDFRRFYACLVYVPREKYSRELRLAIQDILTDALGGNGVDFDTLFSSESVLARIYYIIHTTPGTEPQISVTEIEKRLTEAAYSWQDKLRAAVIEQDGEELGTVRFHAYANAFPASYREEFSTRTAASDISRIESIDETGISMQFYRPISINDGRVHFKLFSADRALSLSDVIPVIENMGVRVEGEHPYELERTDGKQTWIQEFILAHSTGKEIDTNKSASLFQDAFARVWLGQAENDRFNYLVLGAGLNWRDTVVLRAYCKYLLQIRIPFSQDYMIESLVSNPHIAALLAELFHLRFDPAKQTTVEDQEAMGLRILNALEDVAILDQDRILRAYLNVIQATLRTNFFQTNEAGEAKAYLSFKFDPTTIANIPLPKPKYEIFVYSPRMEAVHLRGGSVARGGLRWSDRREDFRTEVLGLMKAQMVKNAVIVPVGSKGGFVCKQLPEGNREAVMEEVISCYKNFMRGLLDITDNIVANEIVPPQNVIRYDGDDPYLVIAADKGTATFSDIANGVSADYGFWLGDAYASGGSVGYDHKKMGITARGAWESVKRHFRELGINTQTTDFSVAGIGDMSGDVFGNGMLLSRHIRLVAAFNHLHIFLDPNPDAEKSFKERERLFNLPRSAWTDYNKKLISKGGGIFPRSAKAIPISDEVKQLLNVGEDQLAPNELIKAILTAKVDLLWNGGIGTYFKATTETNAKASDRANDAVRINAPELRCRVVGEGGNLGFTQLARIQYARNGGKVYTDAIDNSAGVDCSDHEVNIKILLNKIVAEGDMTLKQRNKVLAEMTDEVAELCLNDNYGQTEAISVATARAAENLNEHARFIRMLEYENRLNRELEFLPSDEAIAERSANNEGLTAPELAVLLSYSKMRLYEFLLESDVPEDEFLSNELGRYFPKRLAENYHAQLFEHRLKREIIATHITNSLVTRLGATSVMRIQDETGATAGEIVRAYTAARNIFGIRETWMQLEALDNTIAAKTQIEMLIVVRGLLERAILWLLRSRRPPLNISQEVDYFQTGVQTLASSLPKPLDAASRLGHKRLSKEFAGAGVPANLAATVAGMLPMSSALDIVEAAKISGHDINLVAAVHFELGARLQLQWLRGQVASLSVSNNWHHLARSGLRQDLHKQQFNLTVDALEYVAPNRRSKEIVDAWVADNPASVERYNHIINEIKAIHVADFAMLTVALTEVRSLSRAVQHTAP